MMLRRAGITGVLAALWLAGACGEPTRATLSEAGGRVTMIQANPPGTWYPGELRIQSSQLGEFRAYVYAESPIVVRTARTQVGGTFESFSEGDSVLVRYDPEGTVLLSLPPVIGISRFEIRR